MSSRRYSAYDPFAWFYNQSWGEQWVARVMPVLDKLLLGSIPQGGRILDLCCGTGHLAAALAARGYSVIGVDGSEEMLNYARRNAPDVEFCLADAREFTLKEKCDAAISTYDSLNHIILIEELCSAFAHVRDAIHADGPFLFDLNMEDGYIANWTKPYANVEDDQVRVHRPSYDPILKIARLDLTLFRPVGAAWQRTDLSFEQKAYSETEIKRALASSGFPRVSAFDVGRDLGWKGTGRTFFLAR
jgi:SAM-dependent methyltransferase